jgi:hypothetical protein
MITATASTATFEDLLNDLDAFLSTYGETRPKVTALTAPMSNTDLTFTVDDPGMVDKGYVEIDDELMWIKAIDKGTGVVTLFPWGRAQLSSNAAAHVTGARVTSNPRFPRFRMKQELNNQVNSLYPDLFAILVDESIVYRPPVVSYGLPANLDTILSVSYQTIGATKMWYPVSRWKIDKSADQTAFPTGTSIDIYQGIQPGRTVKIVYRAKPVPFNDDQGSDLLTDHGIQESWRDILQLGAAARCLAATDAARLDLGTIEASNRTNQVQVTSAQQVAKSLVAQQQMRIQQEKRQLLLIHPTMQVRYT